MFSYSGPLFLFSLYRKLQSVAEELSELEETKKKLEQKVDYYVNSFWNIWPFLIQLQMLLDFVKKS